MKKNILRGAAAVAVMLCVMLPAQKMKAAETTDVEINETNFPDSYLREYVSGTFDKNNDQVLQKEEIESVTRLDLPDGITDQKGIEYFYNTVSIFVSGEEGDGSSIRKLDLTCLEKLEDAFVHFDYYDGNSEKMQLKVNGLKNLKELTVRDCYENSLVNGTPAGESTIETIHLEDNPALEEVDIRGAESVIFGETPVLEYLHLARIGNLPLESISGMTNLKSLGIYSENKEFTSLKLKQLADLEQIFVENKYLKSADVRYQTKLKSLQLYGSLSALNTSGNKELEVLALGDSEVTKLNLSKNTELVDLKVENNKLTSLNLSKNTKLVHLWVDHNKLTKLDLSKNTKLETLRVTREKLTKLNVGKLTNLWKLGVKRTKLTSLDLTHNKKLVEVNVSYNKLKKLTFSGNSKLKYLLCRDNQLTALNLQNTKNLETINCLNNKLKNLNVKGLSKLHYIRKDPGTKVIGSREGTTIFTH